MVSSERIYHMHTDERLYLYITKNWVHEPRKAVCEMRRKVEGEKRQTLYAAYGD